jgi:uncharacterized protein YceK
MKKKLGRAAGIFWTILLTASLSGCASVMEYWSRDEIAAREQAAAAEAAREKAEADAEAAREQAAAAEAARA